MKTTIRWVIVAALLFSLTTGAAQEAKPLRKDLLNAVIQQSVSHAEAQEVTLAAGQQAPRHFHPCPAVSYVLFGTVRFQIEGEESRLLKEGEAFYEPKNKPILHFDNASGDKPLRFVVFYLKEDTGENTRLLKE